MASEKKKVRGSAKLSLHGMTPEDALRKALSAPAPKKPPAAPKNPKRSR